MKRQAFRPSVLRNRPAYRLIAILFALAACQGSGTTDTRNSEDELSLSVERSLSSWLVENLDKRLVPGAAWSVVTSEGVVSEASWGFTDRADSAPIDSETIFCIRSVSKSFTALAVLIAVQEGKLDLDEPISTYLPEFQINSLFDKNPGDKITLRHMLGHWAAFAHDPPYGIDSTLPTQYHNYVNRIFETWLRFPVGYRHQYANYGYDLAGHILVRAYGMELAEIMRTKVFVPLGMLGSTIDLAEAKHSSNRAIGHKGELELPVRFPEIASAGIYSSIRDMGKYAAFHLSDGELNGRQILTPDLMAEFHTIQFPHAEQRTGYALGLIREPVGSTYSLYHEGGGRGYGSHLMVYPELDFAVVLLTNLEYHGLTGFEGRQVMNKPIRESSSRLTPEENATRYSNGLEDSDPRILGILGRYGDSPGVTIDLADGRLELRDGENERHDLTMYEEHGQLVGHYGRFMEVRFLHPLGAQPGSMMIVSRYIANHNNHYLDFNDSPRDPFGPDVADWREYVGSYDVIWEDEPESTVEVGIRNGSLYFRDGKCREIEPGLFRFYDGNMVDFRTSPPTYANQELRKRE